MNGSNGNERMVVNIMGWWRKGVRKTRLRRIGEGGRGREGIQDLNGIWNMKYEKAKGQESRIQKYSISE